MSLCTYTAYHIFCFQYLVWFLFYFVVFNGTSIDGANGKGQRLCIPEGHCFHQQKLQVRTISQISLIQHSKPSNLLSNSSQVSEPFKAMIPDIYIWKELFFIYIHVFIAHCLLEIPAVMIYLTACLLCSGLVGWSPGNCLG